MMIDEAIAAFVRGPVTLVLGARNGENLASAVYCQGCRVDLSTNTISVFVNHAAAGEVLDNLRAFPSAALVACRPTTLRTLQLKGTDARVEPITTGDAARAKAYLEMMIEELAQVGDHPDWTRIAFSVELSELIAVAFSPSAIFVQTPGPEAGERIGVQPVL